MTMTVPAAEYERQRVAHLVLEAPRPAPPELKKPEGMAKSAWKIERRRLRDKGVQLAAGIEEQVALREEWRGIEGTPQTLQHAQALNSRPGALARLVATGALDTHQLAAAEEIALAYSRTVADVAVRTARYDRAGGGRKDAAGEGIAAAFLDLAYTQWRAAVGADAAMLLAIIVDDIPVTAAARRYRMSNRRARATLVLALDRWRRPT
ncbi:hypothetical protein [uncultured Sphingomonas sp.]|uniref:hypothetical protein n=1 Tax=uncultured Sphingomonas sp. TaxID=158754 RepID=UPI0025ED96BE|nr:hypothetical protein [uncultured Sphingomonas sp.]